ncbi:MAG TPA: SLC13 family permease [Terracidiphilus sp.]|nr:SLC13 family permease [Terracidiphilus sp.]
MWNNLPVTLSTAAPPDSWYLVACAAGAVLLLLVLIARVRLHPALALAVAALALGVASGMPLKQVPLSFSTGVGNLMAHIAIVLGFGAILGRLLAGSGGAAALGRVLVENCGPKGLPWALLGLGILVGMPVFFEVGLVLLMPIVAEAARRTGRPPVLAGMPLLAGLSIVHGTLPPHPAAMLAAVQYHADLGRTILWGLAAGLPAAALAGPGLGWFLCRRWDQRQKKSALGSGEENLPLFAPTAEEELQIEKREDSTTANQTRVPQVSTLRPGKSAAGAPQSGRIPPPAGPIRAASAVLLPIALIFLGSWADSITPPSSTVNQILHFIGSPDIALLIAVLVALMTLGPRIQTGRHHGRELLRKLTTESFEPIANVLVILAAAGGLSGVLRDSGAAQATVGLALGAHMPPLVLAWLLAAVVRVSMGSATVAMAVASSVLAPLASHAGVRPELLVLATGTGSLILSHVNDPGFWMIQSFFKLEVKDTLATWSVMETVLSVAGLGTTLLLAAALR